MTEKIGTNYTKNLRDHNTIKAKIHLPIPENMNFKKYSNKGHLQIRKRLWTDEVK